MNAGEGGTGPPEAHRGAVEPGVGPEAAGPGQSHGILPGSEGPERPRVRDRQVVGVAALVVVAVLGLQLLGLVVPGFEQLLALQPVVVAALVAVTLVVLLQALWSGARR